MHPLNNYMLVDFILVEKDCNVLIDWLIDWLINWLIDWWIDGTGLRLIVWLCVMDNELVSRDQSQDKWIISPSVEAENVFSGAVVYP